VEFVLVLLLVSFQGFSRTEEDEDEAQVCIAMAAGLLVSRCDFAKHLSPGSDLLLHSTPPARTHGREGVLQGFWLELLEQNYPNDWATYLAISPRGLTLNGHRRRLGSADG